MVRSNSVVIIISLSFLIIQIVDPFTFESMSLKEFYQVTNLNSRNISKLKIKFSRDEVESDHDSLNHDFMLKESSPDGRPTTLNEPKFQLPLVNFRVANVHPLSNLKEINPTLYQIRKSQLAQLIQDKELKDERIRANELELLQDYDIYTTCNWFYPVPSPLNSTQCWFEDIQFIRQKVDAFLKEQGTAIPKWTAGKI